MPAISTLVADLNAGTVVGIGAKPDSSETNLHSELSGTCRVKYSFVHMQATITPGNRFSCASAKTSVDFNGGYVHFADDWSTVGNMDVNRRLLVSGNFSGCMYKVYLTAPVQFKCVHIARPAGAGADALVNLMNGYAAQSGWREIQSVPTAGLIGVGGCAEVVLVSQLFFNQRIDTIRLQLNNQGLVVGRTLVSTPV